MKWNILECWSLYVTFDLLKGNRLKCLSLFVISNREPGGKLTVLACHPSKAELLTHRHLRNIDCLSFVECPLTSPSRNRLLFFLFLLQPFTILMKLTRQAVHTVKQSIFLRCL
jgi:hypothetical protein